MDTPDLNMEDFMDVVYKCKFCPYTCTQSPDMGLHVKEKHLKSLPNPQTELTKHANNAMGVLTSGTSNSMVNASGVGFANTMMELPSKNHMSAAMGTHRADNGLAIQVTDELLSFTTDSSQAYMDKSLVTAVPVSQSSSVSLSNNSTPDLTELINMVKPVEEQRPAVHMTLGNQTHLSVQSIVQLPSAVSETYSAASGDLSSNINQSQSVAVMAIQLPSMNADSNSAPQYIVETAPATQEALSINNTTETKEFLLCGLCKLAFTSMEDCQSHMQMEHRELMQGVGISIGVQAGGGKRGRKRKGESQNSQGLLQPKKEDVFLDPDDMEWLPSVPDGNRTTHRDGRTRRKVIPPKALKEDYVLGRRAVKRRHRKSVTSLGHNMLCPMMSCKARFKTKEGLDIHLSSHNLDDSAFTCPECQASHDFWKHLRFHLWKVHLIDVDLLSCETCGYKTDTLRKMSIHKEIHTNDKPYKCDICDKGFRQAAQQKNHMNIHRSQDKQDSTQWYSSKKCDICDRVFANSKCLAKHKEAVHSKVKPFECSFCSHTTSRKAMMQLHMRTHTGEKPFKCDVCLYTTGDHNSMRRHKMRHTGEKQYRCTLCLYTCIQSISLKQHMKNKHPGVSNGIFQCPRCSFRSINQNHYDSHVLDHKKGLIPDMMISQQPVSPKSKKISSKSSAGSNKQRGAVSQNRVDPAYIKHPQFHTVVPGDETGTLAALDSVGASVSSRESQPEVFNMQVTMLASGDTHVSADDMTRLSENNSLLALGVAPLQLIYATLSTISEQADLTCVEEGRSSLLTIELLGGIQTAVLSSVQEGAIIHSITYHFPAVTTLNNEVKQPDQRGRASNDGGGAKTVAIGRSLDNTKDLKMATVKERQGREKMDASVVDPGQDSLNMIASSFESEMISQSGVEMDKGEEVMGKSANDLKMSSEEAMFFINDDKGSWKKDRDLMEGGSPQVESIDENLLMGEKGVVIVNPTADLLSPSKLDSEPVQNIPTVMVSEQSVAVINTGTGGIHMIPNFLEPIEAQGPQTFIANSRCLQSV